MENKFFVGVNGLGIIFMRTIPNVISTEDAVNLAAWIVALVPREQFEAALREVESL